ncbi:MAG TPA: type III PLP-dependent enzyme [bacterium]|nr:type III PLP-dependent enzyme [bacterium]
MIPAVLPKTAKKTKDKNGHKAWMSELVKKHGTPLFVIDKSKLQGQVERFRKALPRVTPFFAVKANPCTDIVRTFADMGIGFDVASRNEIESVFSCGVTPDRMVFANTTKRPADLKYAVGKDVTLMTFDSEYELHKLAKHAPGARVLVRIKVPNVGSTVELSIKFGVDPGDAIPLLIKAYKLGLKPVGLSFHVGSQCTKVENYVEAFEMASIIMKDARLKQLPFEILDIGGGFPITHFDHEDDLFDTMAPVIGKELDRLFDDSIRIIAEPGRFLAGPAGMLIMRVVGKSIRMNKHWYYLDDGVYGCLSGIIYDHCKYQYKVLKKGQTQISTIAGPTCDSLDVISYTEDMPEMDVGDIVYVENIGAYSYATATNFNSIPPAKVIFEK